jgi:anti-sigma regulatory factor (Ser/Thr protein kinase)
VRGHPRYDDIVLLASELITNAVVHSDSALPGGMVTILVSRTAGFVVRVEVVDAGSRQHVPHVREVDIDVDSGKGLSLVEKLSLTWGTSTNGTGRTVWFEMAGT